MAVKVHMKLCLVKEFVMYSYENTNLHQVLLSDFYINECANNFDDVITAVEKIEIIPDRKITDFIE